MVRGSSAIVPFLSSAEVVAGAGRRPFSSEAFAARKACRRTSGASSCSIARADYGIVTARLTSIDLNLTVRYASRFGPRSGKVVPAMLAFVLAKSSDVHLSDVSPQLAAAA